jgi:flagellar biosynthesis GTPase FlhF
MDIQERANEYAKGRLVSIIERLIADIYTDGYKAGYQTKTDEVDEVVLQKIAEAKAEVARTEAIKAAERAEAERIAREKAEAEKAEVERIAREKAEKKRIAEEEAEAKKIAEEEVAKQKKAAEKKAENDKKDANIKDVKFIDLQLPSGTLWATEYIGEMTYREAKKRYHLPTLEQINELKRECKLTIIGTGDLKVLNAEGKWFTINSNGRTGSIGSVNSDYLSKFWIDEEEDSNKNVRYAEFRSNYYGVTLNLQNKFVGESLSVLVVKSKQ